MQPSNDSNFLADILLFGAVGFWACVLWSMQGIKNSYKENSTLGIIGNIIFKSCSATVLSVGTVLLLPDTFMDVTITDQIRVGIAVVMAVFGQGIIDVILRRKFGLTIADLLNKDDIAKIHAQLDEQEKNDHIAPNSMSGHSVNITKKKDINVTKSE